MFFFPAPQNFYLCFEHVDNLGAYSFPPGDRLSHPICLHQQFSTGELGTESLRILLAKAADDGQILALLCRQPVPDTHSQQPDTLHATYSAARSGLSSPQSEASVQAAGVSPPIQVYG